MQVLLEVAIGLVLTFAVVAVVVSSAMELIAAITRLRSRVLEQGVARLLDNEGKRTPGSATEAVVNHPLIRALSSARAQHRLPSYIDAVTFASALLGSAIAPQALLVRFAEDRDQVESRINALPVGRSRATLEAAWAACQRDPTKLIAALLGDDDNGKAALAELISPSIEARINELTEAGDPAAVPISRAWETAKPDTERFVGLLERPDLMTRARGGVNDVNDALAEISQLNSYLGQSLNALWQRAGEDFTKFRHEIEDWFDREMARVSGWYSRWSQWIMVIVALVIVSALNISAVTVGRALWLDPTTRDKAVAVAQQQAGSTASTPPSQTPQTSPTPQTTPTPAATCPSSATTTPSVGVDTLCEIGLPIGWNSTAWPGLDWYLLLHILGIIAVAIAGSFGAPFWFDALNRIVNLRAAGRPPTTAADQRAKQAQT